LVNNGKANSFILLNGYHRNWLDNFFIVYTNLGDGIFASMLALFYFFVLKKRKLGVVLLLAYASTGILAQIIKPLMHSPRPLVYFRPQHFPFFIDSIIHAGNNSFPSGHTVTAFAMVTVLAFYTSNKIQYIFLLLAAAMVAFSRVYLSQHFLLDVLGGSSIAVLGGIACVHFTRNINEDQLVFKKKKKVE
jgi:membrane-associated phospholipid phosphatase